MPDYNIFTLATRTDQIRGIALRRRECAMNPHERVLAACAFELPDRIPTIESFWEYPDDWQACLGPLQSMSDVVIWCPNEGAYPSRARRLRDDETWIYEVDRWGRVIRKREGAFFYETLASPVTEHTDLDNLHFESPDLDSRFLDVESESLLDAPAVCQTGDQTAVQNALQETKRRACLFGKTGGPYLRSTFLRGEVDFLTEVAFDPARARALADRVAEHLVAVGVEQVRRWGLYDTGIWIFDDVAFNGGPMCSPRAFERIFLPAYRCMVQAFKQAGASYVFFHSDGDIRLLLDMLIDAGIDGINPVEPRANMRVADLRKKYPRLIMAGGMDNTGTLIQGPLWQIKAEACDIIDVGRSGGVIIGSGSIGPDVPLHHYALYRDTCLTYGAYADPAAYTAQTG